MVVVCSAMVQLEVQDVHRRRSRGRQRGPGPAIFSALDPVTGAIIWQTRDVLRSHILVAGDRLLVLRDETGGLSLATFDRQGVKVVATAQVLAESASSPASLAGTTLYARDRAKIVAIDLSEKVSHQ